MDGHLGNTSCRIGWALLLAGFLGACAPEEPAPPPTFHVDTLASGAVSVTNTGTPVWSELSRWTVEEDLRIGTLAGEEPDQFSSIHALTVDDERRIYVLEQEAQEIRVFQPDGTYAHTIGGRGEEDGQLRGAIGMKLTPDRRILTYDIYNSRYSIFERDGTFVTGYPLEIRGGWLISPWIAEFDSRRQLIDWGMRRPEERGATDSDVSYFPIRLSRDYGVQDTLTSIDWSYRMTGGAPVPYGGGVAVYLDRQEAIWFGHTPEYRLYRRTLAGDTTLVFTLPATPEVVTAEEKDSLAQERSTVGFDLRIRPDDIPDTKPVIRRILGDNNGHIMVIPRLDGIPSGTVIDVFMETGVYLGRMALPQQIELSPLPVFRGPFMYAVVTDEFDVPYVVRWRIRRGSGA